MKTCMPLDGFRWSCDSDSALCDMRQTNVLGRAGGGFVIIFAITKPLFVTLYSVWGSPASKPWWSCGVRHNGICTHPRQHCRHRHLACPAHYRVKKTQQMKRNVSER